MTHNDIAVQIDKYIDYLKTKHDSNDPYFKRYIYDLKLLSDELKSDVYIGLYPDDAYNIIRSSNLNLHNFLNGEQNV